MLFRVDIYASTMVIAAIWLLFIYSWLSGRSVRMGDPADPHMNLFSPTNDVNVCNYHVFGQDILQQNTSAEIKCYVESMVHKQSKLLWQDCPYTLYDVLHAAKAGEEPLNVLVFVDDLPSKDDAKEREQRSTPWGDQQSDNLVRLLEQSVNEWRGALHEAHPGDFYKKDHEIKIRGVTCPGQEGKLTRYPSLGWSEDKDHSKGLFKKSVLETFGTELHARDTRAHKIDIVICFEDAGGRTFASVTRQFNSKSGFITKHCLNRGVTVFINDTAKEDIKYYPKVEFGLLMFATSFVLLSAVIIMWKKKTDGWMILSSLVLSAIFAAVSTHTLPIPDAPIVDGHPKRFSSDVFPVALLTHELGHTLLMPDHYQKHVTEDGGEVIMDTPGPIRPFECPMTPISVMGAEIHVTALDRAFVQAFWAMRQGQDFEYDDWTIKKDAMAGGDDGELRHTGAVNLFISNYINQARTETNTKGDNVYETCVSGGSKQGCITYKDHEDLMKRSCFWNEDNEAMEPNACAVPGKMVQERFKPDSKRVRLTGDRQFLHYWTNTPLGLVVEGSFVVMLTAYFYDLWRRNQASNLQSLENGQHLHYRELLNNKVIVVIILYAVYVWQKTTNIARCIGVEDSIANHVVWAQILLAIPMIPLILRRVLVMLKVSSAGELDAEEGKVSENWKDRVGAEKARLKKIINKRRATEALLQA